MACHDVVSSFSQGRAGFRPIRLLMWRRCLPGLGPQPVLNLPWRGGGLLWGPQHDPPLQVSTFT